MKYALALILVVLAGCAPQPSASIQSNSVRYNAPYVVIYETRLADGTRCVYLSNGNAITCEWRQPVVLMPSVQ